MPVVPQDSLKLAVSAILLAVLALSFGDAIIKLLSSDMTLWQIYLMRSCLALPILLLIVRLGRRGLNLMPLALGWTIVRSLLLGFMWIAYYAALPHIQLSIAAAVYYTIPLFIALFSALFTGDRVTTRSWLAISIGFAGVLIIVRPQGSEFNFYLLLPLLAAILYALAMILTRTRCRDESPEVMSMVLNVTFIIMGLVASILIGLWNPSESLVAINPFLLGELYGPSARDWLAMLILAFVVVVGSIFAAVAYQRGSLPVIATFDYSYLAFSAVWGLLFFGEFPDAPAIAGMLMIVGAGIMVVKSNSAAAAK